MHALLQWKIQSGLSFNCLESAEFDKFLSILRPGFVVPCRRTMQSRIKEMVQVIGEKVAATVAQ